VLRWVGSAIMIQEFKDFVAKGNVVMLGVGFIMGVAFQSVINSLVENVIMPIVAIVFGQPNFDSLTWTVNGAVIMWGTFVTTLVVFVLTALAVFLVIVKPYNAYQARTAEEEVTEEPGPSEVELLTQIRDALESGRS
jgi:large conductance mechanosensitive channel